LIIRDYDLGSLLAGGKKALFGDYWGSFHRKFQTLSLGPAGMGIKPEGGVSKVNIWSPPHTLFLANQLVESLSEIGIKARVVERATVLVSRADLDVILAPAFFGFPSTRGPRIVFQLEQTTSTKWFSPEYVKYMNSSLAVFEYSQFNVEGLIQQGVDPLKIYYVPLGGSSKVFMQSTKSRAKALARDKKIMAYGWFTGSPRREKFIEYARDQIPSLIVHTDVFGGKMARELESSDVVVHINYYTPAILATPRLWESLSRGCQVVSEKALNWEEDPYLLGLVQFVDEDEFDLVRDRVNEVKRVELEEQHRLTPIEASEMRFRFMLARGLFGAGAIDHGTFTQQKKPNRD
jgi:hypothetical protein